MIVVENTKLLTKFLKMFWFYFFAQDAVDQHFAIPLMAGMSARVFSVSIVSPLELIRTKMQSQKLSYYGEFELDSRNVKSFLSFYSIFLSFFILFSQIWVKR